MSADIDESLTKLFQFYDTNGDGTLTKSEKLEADKRITGLLKEAGQGGSMRTEKFDSMDADASGGVSLDEFVASWKAKYSAYPPEMQTRMLGVLTEVIA